MRIFLRPEIVRLKIACTCTCHTAHDLASGGCIRYERKPGPDNQIILKAEPSFDIGQVSAQDRGCHLYRSTEEVKKWLRNYDWPWHHSCPIELNLIFTMIRVAGAFVGTPPTPTLHQRLCVAPGTPFRLQPSEV